MMRTRGKAGLLCYLRRYGQCKAEPRPGAWRILHPDALAVRLDERPRDREPEAGARVVLAAREEPEDLLPPAGGHAGASVGDGYLDRVAVRAELSADQHAAVGGAVPDRVVDQVGEHPGHEHEVRVDRGQAL